jgi:hypothetical protein
MSTNYLWVQENFINLTRNCRFGQDEPQQTRFGLDEPGALYMYLRSEYGRCVSKVYLDTKSRGTIAIGWVFQKKMEYEDAYRISDKSERVYVREVWVTVMEPCELDDPLALRKQTRLGEEVIRLKHKVIDRT